MMDGSQMVLVDGKPDKVPTYYAGSIRLQAVPNPGLAQAGDDAPTGVIVQIATEPKLRLQNVVRTHIDKAVDDQDQKLSPMMADERGGAVPVPPRAFGGPPGGGVAFQGRPFSMGGPNQVAVLLKKGDKPSKSLKELAGTITAQVLDAPQEMIVVDNILKAGGTTVKGKPGGQIKVLDVSKPADGQIKVRVEMELPEGVVPGNGGLTGIGVRQVFTAPAKLLPAVPAPPPPAPVQKPAPPVEKKEAPAAKPNEAPAQAQAEREKAVAVERQRAVMALQAAQVQRMQMQMMAMAPMRRAGFANGLSLVDRKGQPLQLVGMSLNTRAAAGAPVTSEYELTFQVQEGQGEPAKLVFTGSRVLTIDIPFTFKDVPLK
jgi:hypothetical protein